MNREPYYNWQWKVLLVNGMCLQTKDIYQKDGSFFKPSRPKMMTRGWLWLPKLKRKSKGLNFAVHIYTHTTSQARYLYSSALPIVNWKFHKIVHSGEFQIQLSVTQLELNSFSLNPFCTFFNFPTWLCVWSSSNAKKITKVLSSRIYVTSFTLWFFMKMCEGHRVWCTYFSPLFRNS